jgi:hypothetical protein
MPLTRRSASALETSVMGDTAPTASGVSRRSRARAAGVALATTVSTSVFHAPQDGHWPAQRGVSAPHCWQTWTERTAGTG